ncbi:MAG: phosphatidylserine decarboxylase family protein [Candidatus Marinimicrobia bacterium]|nr:phosphatidylserine decarboxylase family protein [Candidatus Neomarinimicrobiota bacterium]
MIAPEGKIILIPASILLLIFGFMSFKTEGMWIKSFFIFDFIFVIFSLYFFRDPDHAMPEDKSLFISPADGKVVQIIDVNDLEVGQAKQISIFLSVFNVHKQAVPMSSTVLHSKYNKGKFLAAWNHKASMDNEQTEILFETESGMKYKIKQIAGLIARRILCYMVEGESVERGDRLGFIRFGSRVDIIVPFDFKIKVKVGDIVKNRISVIGSAG